MGPNADTFDILLARSRCLDEEIEAGGLAPLVAAAEERLDAVCEKAAHLLNAYRITKADIRALCETHIEEGSREFRETDRAAVRQIAAVWELVAPFGVRPEDVKELIDERLRGARK